MVQVLIFNMTYLIRFFERYWVWKLS